MISLIQQMNLTIIYFYGFIEKKEDIEDPVSLPSYSEFVEFGLDNTMTNVSADGQNITVTGHTF